MAYGRTRTRVVATGMGYSTYLYGGTTQAPWPTNSHVCADIVGNPDGANPLHIEHMEYIRPGTVNRGVKGVYLYTLENYPFTNQGFISIPSVPWVIPSDTQVITNTMARTNPSRPFVSVPLMLAELRDIPGMLRQKGQRYADGRHNSSVVSYNFGWQPMISDLLKMADFTDHLDRKLNHLDRLYSAGGLSRNTSKQPQFSETVVGQLPNTTFQSAMNAGVHGYVRYTYTHRTWGSVRWRVPAPFKGTRGELGSLARRLVHGWDLSPHRIIATIWETLPWSWFADYFSNIGDVLEASNNSLGQVAENGCVMNHDKCVQTQIITSVSSPSDTFPTAGSYRYEMKTRTLANAGVTAFMPFLTAGQLVTLSSLAQSLAGPG